ncbi:tetratricopeptide repeat protein [Winogradskyella sp.]|uniref:tetratricopeptide repeat-containing sensor histidine kinase n=1 Tax=Winogradskyella sp. TaxID=1883156 RepID=UPI0025F9AC60|nr:tetratricopeptide repeat protein [Winogradskyella sp.]MCT4630403.1 sensor histidine kinase [Winogradskyella sp.]
MKKQFILYLSFLCVLISFSQNTVQQDSLLNVIKTTTNVEDKASAHGKYAWLNLMSDLQLAEKHLDTSLALYSQIQNEKGIARSNYRFAVLYRLQGAYDKGLTHIEESLKFAQHSNDSLSIANNLFQKAVIYSLKGDYDKGLEVYMKILSVYEAMDFKKGIGLTLNSIGITYGDLGKHEDAIRNYKKAIEIHEASNDSVNLPNVYGNLALTYSNQKKHDLALEYYSKARDIDIATNNNWGLAINSENIGLVLQEQGKYGEAISFFEQARSIFEKNKLTADLSRVYANLGNAYFLLGDLNKSKSYLQSALENKTDSKKVTMEIHSNLSKLYKKMGRYGLALNHYEDYTIYKDSVFEEDRIKNINDLQLKYETTKKNKEIAEQQLELNKKEGEILKKSSQIIYMTGIAIFLLVATILVYLVFQQKQKRKNQEILTLKREYQIKALESLIEGEEKERFRIAKELHDGVNGDLSAIKHKLSSLLEMNNKVINEAITMIDDSCEQVRAISHNLVPPSLENFNLVEATENYCDNLNAVNKESITFQYIGEAVQMSKKAEVNVFRIIQELVTNALKHAEANEINVQISNRDQLLQITVEDNGKGFDKNTIESKGIGLSNIQSRVEYLNAEIDMLSNDKGTSCAIDIDLNTLNDN